MAKAVQRKGSILLIMSKKGIDAELLNDAIVVLKKALELDSKSWKTCQNLCQAYINKYNQTDKKEDFLKAIEYGEKGITKCENKKCDVRLCYSLADAYRLVARSR